MQERQYQTDAVNATLDYFVHGGKGNPLVCMPAGSGKSYVIANTAKSIIEAWPDQTIIMATIARQLVDQNAEKLRNIWPDAPLGVCSAALRKFDTNAQIIYGSIGTIANRVDKIGPRSIMFVDEAQAISHNEETQFRKYITKLKTMYPHMPVIGYTATPYRMKTGMLTEKGGVFTDIAYNITDRASYNRLVDEGYLAPLVTSATKTFFDASQLHMQGGDFKTSEAADLIAKQELLTAALREVCEHGENRQSWLVFVPDVDNIEFVVNTLRNWGIAATGVHSRMSTGEVDANVEAFKAGAARCMVVADMLTVGFDHPPIDLIACFRPTMSPGWWVQAISRGARPSPETGKYDCLVLDFTGNTRRVGYVNDPFIPRKGGKKTGDAPIRICGCGIYNYASARFCGGYPTNHERFNPKLGCGYEFPRVMELGQQADTMPVVAPTEPQYAWLDVKRVVYTRHQTDTSKPATMRVSYWYAAGQVSEWLAFESPHMGPKARSWWAKRCTQFAPPDTTDQALALQACLKQPTRIYVRMDTKYKEVKDYEFDTANGDGTARPYTAQYSESC